MFKVNYKDLKFQREERAIAKGVNERTFERLLVVISIR